MPRVLSNADIAILQDHLITAQTAHAQNPGADNATRDAARRAYYDQLEEWGYQYGQLAGGVVTNELVSGRVANNFFLRVSGKEGARPTQSEFIDLSLALMQADFEARADPNSGPQLRGEPLGVDIIERYHVEVFDDFDISGQAWTPFFLLNGTSLTGQELVEYRENVWNDLLNAGDNIVSQLLTSLRSISEIAENDASDDTISKYAANVTIAGCYATVGLATSDIFNNDLPVGAALCAGFEAAVDLTHRQNNIQRLNFVPEPSVPCPAPLL